MLRRDTGAYLFEHTVRNAARASLLERVVLATDADEILAAARSVGIEALATSPDHPSGTDRVNEAYARLGVPYDVVVNVQGDEPELPPASLDLLIGAFADDAVEIATLCAPLETRAEALAPGVVKVVRDARGDALYFSRAAIPAGDHPARRAGAPAPAVALRHVGVYAFRPAALAAFCALPQGALEVAESLEQLRWLEAGRRMRVLAVARATAGIDTEQDYAAFVARWSAQRKESERVAEQSRAR
jgi:3-deoxy-manno-octulosonate cytidylyltransferase (CMP-KDO synthetase)